MFALQFQNDSLVTVIQYFKDYFILLLIIFSKYKPELSFHVWPLHENIEGKGKHLKNYFLCGTNQY